MLAVILAGGKGSRLQQQYPNTPKPMIEIEGKPILHWQIEMFKREGITDFLLIVGYRHEQILSYFGDGSRFGVSIRYFIEQEPMGTAGALFQTELPDTFLLCNGDLMLDITLGDFFAFHQQRQALISLFVHPSSHPFDSMVVHMNADGVVTAMAKGAQREETFSVWGNAGVCLFEKKAFCALPVKAFMNLDEDVIVPNIASGGVYSYRCGEYVKDAGTAERLAEIEKDLQRGIPAKSRNAREKKAVFLDRDGTLNRHKGYITAPEQLELVPDAAQAVSRFHALGYQVILITNQPVVARGECTLEELEAIHRRLQFLLAKEGAYLDGIYYCPHHPDAGFEGENKAYKRDCDCRKPKPGMLFKAAKERNIDLAQSFMVGDSLRDVQTAWNAGCRAVLIGKEEPAGDYERYDALTEFANRLEKDE